ncbi:MAG: uncharacterized protein QG559_1379 [Campylobacterota bacterium]|nr:uncharacterized protein [Campylobacterota bacterium]
MITSSFINDTIYSHIEHTKLEAYLLQSKIVSRLQFITQNALAYFAFPSINTKRYIHSIGTMHIASHMYKSALLNANKTLRNKFLKELYTAIKKIEPDAKSSKVIQKSDFFEDDTLYQFLIPLRDEKEKYAYLLSLEAIRVAALLHDVGHFPFSHQVEYAMESLYEKYAKTKEKNTKESKFIEFYELLTNKNNLVLHEAMGLEFTKMLFEYEVPSFLPKKTDKEYVKVVYKLAYFILEDKVFEGFDFGVIHSIINSTVDADRLDYINRDMLSSGYIGGAVDLLRIAKQAVLTSAKEAYTISFFDNAILDIEHMLEMRFNLYKKVIFNHQIAKKDAMLENLIVHLVKEYFNEPKNKKTNNISMLWNFLKEKESEKRLDTISLLDENWLISLFKEDYFNLKYSQKTEKEKVLMIFEEVLFGKKYFNSIWKNLNDLYGVLGFTTKEKYQFRESFGYITPSKLILLKNALDNFIALYEKKNKNLFFSYQIVSFKLGVSKDFCLFNNESLVTIDEISTLRKRLKKSMQNTVPFFLYCNQKELSEPMREDLKEILISVFK